MMLSVGLHISLCHHHHVCKLAEVTGAGLVDITHGVANIVINLVGPPPILSFVYIPAAGKWWHGPTCQTGEERQPCSLC